MIWNPSREAHGGEELDQRVARREALGALQLDHVGHFAERSNGVLRIRARRRIQLVVAVLVFLLDVPDKPYGLRRGELEEVTQMNDDGGSPEIVGVIPVVGLVHGEFLAPANMHLKSSML